MRTTKIFFQAFSLLIPMIVVILTSDQADAQNTSSEETTQLAILRSDAPNAEKAIACKKLAIHGSSESVSDLAKLLPNGQLSSWARIALEAIPGNEADEALRSASQSLNGRLLAGTLNSIGVRRDAGAVELLTGRLQDTDPEVASAAAVALGRIGNDAATNSLRQGLTKAGAEVRSAIAEGVVLCAERLLAEGRAELAVVIYDEIRNADVPTQRIVEATRGAILARNQDGIPLLIETLQSPEKKLFQLALGAAREFPGDEVDNALAVAMANATPARSALIIQAMADRPETVVLPAILNAAKQGNKEVRLSAIDALRRVGDDSCLADLLKIAVDPDADLAQSAQATLADLPGANVDSRIVAMLPEAKANTYPLLLQLIGQRRIDAVPDVLKALNHSDQTVRSAAWVALGETVALDRLSLLIGQVVDPKHPEDVPVATRALNAASIRMPDREACATKLVAAFDQSPVAARVALLEILSNVGGSTALKKLAAAAKTADPQLQDASSRLLGKWNSVDAAPILLDLANSAPAEKYRIRALRGYIGLARKFAMPDQQRAEMCQTAMDVAVRADEQKLALDVLKIHPGVLTLKVAIHATQIPEIKDEATACMLAIAQKLGGQGVDVKTLLSAAGLDKVQLEIMKAEYGAGTRQKDVTETLRQQAGELPLISLTPARYNDAFGGDPVPGVVKQLKVQYRINGKPGEALFAENDLIILPMPK